MQNLSHQLGNREKHDSQPMRRGILLYNFKFAAPEGKVRRLKKGVLGEEQTWKIRARDLSEKKREKSFRVRSVKLLLQSSWSMVGRAKERGSKGASNHIRNKDDWRKQKTSEGRGQWIHRDRNPYTEKRFFP